MLPCINIYADLVLGSVQVSEMIPDDQQASAADSQGVSVSSLQQLLNEGLAIQLQLSSLQRLQAILQGHQAWELQMKQVLQGILVSATQGIIFASICNYFLLAHLECLPSTCLHESPNPRGYRLQSWKTLSQYGKYASLTLGSRFCMTATYDPGSLETPDNANMGPPMQVLHLQQIFCSLSSSKQPACVCSSGTACLLAGGAKPTYSQLLDLQCHAQASPIKSPLLPELVGILFVADQWLQRCTEAIARRSAQTLKSCLEAMAASVQRAQEQMEAQLRKLQVRPSSPSSSSFPLPPCYIDISLGET